MREALHAVFQEVSLLSMHQVVDEVRTGNGASTKLLVAMGFLMQGMQREKGF